MRPSYGPGPGELVPAGSLLAVGFHRRGTGLTRVMDAVLAGLALSRWAPSTGLHWLGATTDTTDAPGFEQMSRSGDSVMTLELMPVQIDGTTTYTPVSIGRSHLYVPAPPCLSAADVALARPSSSVRRPAQR